MQVLEDATLTAEVKYPVSFRQLRKRFALGLQYNEETNTSLLMLQKHIKSKQKTIQNHKILWIKDYALYLGNILKNLTIYNMKKTDINENVYIFFSVDLNPNVAKGILDIHRYLMKEK